MDREEAIRLLKSGREGIKKWNSRLEYSAGTYDRVNLQSVDLSECEMQFVDLSGVYLENTNFFRSNLLGAEFDSSMLKNADFSCANLQAANFFFAEMQNSKVCECDLTYTNFFKSQLDNVDFRGSYLSGTVFSGVDLSNVLSLDLVEHVGLNTIGLDTLLKSKDLPDSFLLGCGIPETILEYVKALPNSLQPVQFYSCFISYSHKDEEFAQRLHGRMRQEGLRVWYAPEDMKGGRNFIIRLMKLFACTTGFS